MRRGKGPIAINVASLAAVAAGGSPPPRRMAERGRPDGPLRGVHGDGVKARPATAQLCGSVGVAASVVTCHSDYGYYSDHHDDASPVYGDVFDQDPRATLHAQPGTPITRRATS